MSRYLTPDRFRSMGFGIDLTDVEDVELAMHIARASSKVNTFCAAPKLPQEHDFAGGTAVHEQHRWPFGTDTTRGTRRVYPFHRPVKSVEAFSIRVTNTTAVTVTGNDIFINNTEGYLELISLAAISFGILPSGILPNLGLYTPVAEVSYTYGYEFSSTKEELFATDALTYRSVNSFWKPNSEVVYEDGATVSGGAYSVNIEDGTVRFTSPPSGTITADYIYTMPNEITQATGEIVADQLAETSLTAKGMRRLAAITMAEISLRRTMRGVSKSDDLTADIPASAALLLEPYRFRSVQ